MEVQCARNEVCGFLQVIPGSPAFRAGVLNDDVIIEFNGVPVTTIDQVCKSILVNM